MKMVQTISAVAVILLVHVMFGCLGQVMLDEDIDDTSDMDGGYGDDHKLNGRDSDNGKHNDLYPDHTGRKEFIQKSPYDDDDLDHRGHEHSEVLHNDSSNLESHDMLLKSSLFFLVTSYKLWISLYS